MKEREKTQAEWMWETLAFYAKMGIAVAPAQVMLGQREIKRP